MDCFIIEEDRSSGYTGSVDASHKWGLPGILNCPACKATWSGISKAYPSVDLRRCKKISLPSFVIGYRYGELIEAEQVIYFQCLTPVASLADFEKARPEPIEEYERLCELVRPLLPPGAV